MAKARITDYNVIKELSINLLKNSNLPQKLVAFGLDNKNRIISIGYNSYTKTHPLQAKYATMMGVPNKIYLHAEVSAIIGANEQICTIVVSRVNNHGRLLLARPCECCMQAIYDTNINKIVYSTSDDVYVEELIERV